MPIGVGERTPRPTVVCNAKMEQQSETLQFDIFFTKIIF